MLRKFEFKNPDFTWVDVVTPQREELESLAATYHLHPTSVQDCLDPEHLPKFEKIGDIHFLIVRTFDETANADCDEVQELTRKIAVFYTDGFLLTIHRADQLFIEQMRNKWSTFTKDGGRREPDFSPLPYLLYDLILGTLQSFEKPIDGGLTELEKLEMAVFGAHRSQPFQIEHGYYLKRRASVFKRIVRLTIDVLPKVSATMGAVPTKYQDIKDEGDSLIFYSDELLDNVNTLLNLHISLSSQRVNEATYRTGEGVRVLTIFSVFLLPLNLVTGIYGMNFEHIPEIKWEYGYPGALVLMFMIELGIYLWFQKKGWLK